MIWIIIVAHFIFYIQQFNIVFFHHIFRMSYFTLLQVFDKDEEIISNWSNRIIVECIWWRPWFLQKRRALQVLRGGWAWQQIGPLGKREFFSCWIWRAWILQWQFCQRYREWRSSWCSWLSLRFRCRGALAWGLCRCRLRRSRLFFF